MLGAAKSLEFLLGAGDEDGAAVDGAIDCAAKAIGNTSTQKIEFDCRFTGSDTFGYMRLAMDETAKPILPTAFLPSPQSTRPHWFL
jgi:hypothetical protein